MPVGLNENPVGFVDPAMPLDWSHPLNRGLVSRWKVIPNSGWRGGLTFRDLVRGGKKPNDGTLTNGPTWVGGGRRGGYGALNFVTASSQYVDTGATFNALANAVTWSAWVYVTTTPSNTYQIMSKDKDGAGLRNWQFGLNGFNNVYVEIYKTDGSASSIAGTPPVTSSRWTHIAATYQYVTDGTSRIYLYVDGVPNLSNTSCVGPMQTSATNVDIGRRAYAGFEGYMGGRMDELLIYDRVLSAKEVAAIYQEQLRGSPETLKWVGARTYGFSEQAAATGGTPIFSSGILSSRIIGGGGIAA